MEVNFKHVAYFSRRRKKQQTHYNDKENAVFIKFNLHVFLKKLTLEADRMEPCFSSLIFRYISFSLYLHLQLKQKISARLV